MYVTKYDANVKQLLQQTGYDIIILNQQICKMFVDLQLRVQFVHGRWERTKQFNVHVT